MICEASPNAISLQEWGFGRTPSDAPDGLTSAQFGQALAPANLSHRQAKAMGLETSGIYGLRSSTSSRSAALKSFAESRLRQRTAMLGSTLYRLIWKDWVTPSGRSFSLLRASAVRAKGTEFGGSGWTTPSASDSHRGGTGITDDMTGSSLVQQAPLAAWPTPKTKTGGPNSNREARGAGGADLQEAAQWAGWPTATVSDARSSGARGYGGNEFMTLTDAAKTAGWPTPQANDAEKRGTPTQTEGSQSCLPTAVPALAGWTMPAARDWRDTPGMTAERSDEKSRTDQLPRQAYLAGWPTCRAEDSESAGARHSRGIADTVVAVARTIHRAGWPTPGMDSFRSRSGDRKDEMGIQQLAQSTLRIPNGPARLTAFGEIRIGYSAQMGGGEQLNPEHSRWLMGCPAAWARSAPGWQDYALWQELTAIASPPPSDTEKGL